MSTTNKEKRKSKEKARKAKSKVSQLKQKPLVLTEVEVLKIQKFNERIARWQSEKRRLQTEMAAVDRNGNEATKELAAVVKSINTRLDIDLRGFNIEDDGRLIPVNDTKKGGPPVASSAPPVEAESEKGSEESDE